MTRYRKRLGDWGETLAAEYLSGKGVLILGRNVRTKFGELDIIGNCCGTTVIFEVKTRMSDKFGNPEDAITQQKRSHLIAAAESYIQEHPELPDHWRIDVIAIRSIKDNLPEIEWFENAVS